MGKRRLIGKIVILMLGLAAVVILAANSDTIPVSTPKKGYRVVIDPGHGGSDCGAVGVSGVKEAGLNLAVSLYLKEELEALALGCSRGRSRSVGSFCPLDHDGLLAVYRAANH